MSIELANIFFSTVPRASGRRAGRNHGHELYEQARQRLDWFTTVRTTEDTRRDGPGEEGGPIISAAQIEEEIAAGMPRALANQEFGCSFVAAAPGAYFAKELEEAERAGRIRHVPWDPRLGVTTAWDLGISDAMAIVFAQTTGIEVRIIDYLEDTGQGLAHYAKRLAEKSYRYTEHISPHDAEQRELGITESAATRRGPDSFAVWSRAPAAAGARPRAFTAGTGCTA